MATYIGVIIIPKIVLISKRKRLYDSINNRKSHTGAISRLGGVSFFPAIILSLMSTILASENISTMLDLKIKYDLLSINMSGYLAGATLLYFIGLADDVIGMGYKNKLYAQFVTGVFLVLSGLSIVDFEGLFGIGELPLIVSVLLTIFVIIGVVNSFNLIDGIDGLCAGMAIIITAPLLVWFMINQSYMMTILASAFLGICSVFFIFNTKKGRLKLFMGDVGSLAIGFTIAYLLLMAIRMDNDSSSPYLLKSPLLIAFSMIFVPMTDALRVFSGRMMRKESPFYPDKTHLHHILLSYGFTHINCTYIILLMSLSIFLITLLLSFFLSSNILFILLLIYGIFIAYIIPTKILSPLKSKLRK